MKPEFKPVKSSNIAEVAHHGNDLYVRFNGGGTWKYADVDAELHKSMIEADSVGKFFNAHIRGAKTGEKVDLSEASAAGR